MSQARVAPSQRPRTPSVHATLAANGLGLGGVLSAAGAAIAPAVVVAGLISTGYVVTGVTGFPIALLAVALVLALFVPGYTAAATRIRNAGAFYTYVARGLGAPAGVAAAGVAIPAYAAMSVATYGAIGYVGSSILVDKLGVPVSWWIVALAAWLVVTILSALRISISGRVLGTTLLAEVIVVLAADVVNLAHPYQGRVTVDAWDPSTLSGHWGVALAIAATAFVGFEAAAAFAEETRGTKTVPVATTLALLGAFAVYALSGWAMAVTTGSFNLQVAAVEHGPDLPFVTAAEHLGSNLIIDVGRLLFVTSLFAAALAYHNPVSRYLFALGRESVLPAWLGRTSPRTSAPINASIVQSLVGLVVIITYAVADADPLVQLFFWGGTVGGLGVLLLVTATSVSVIGILGRDPFDTPLPVRTFLPGLAALLLGWMSWLIIDNLTGLLGVASNSPLRWMVPCAYAVLALAGLAWAGYLRRQRPDTYDVIGLDANPHLHHGPSPSTPARSF